MKKKIKDLTHAEVLSICEKYYDEACPWDCPYCLQDNDFDDESNGCKLDEFGDYADEEVEVEEREELETQKKEN